MKFLHHLFSSNKPTGVDKIEGYEDIKDIVMCALDSEDSYNILSTGPPASAKTLFLLEILEELVKKHDDPGEIAEIIKTLAKYGEPRLVRGYGFPPELDVCDPIERKS